MALSISPIALNIGAKIADITYFGNEGDFAVDLPETFPKLLELLQGEIKSLGVLPYVVETSCSPGYSATCLLHPNIKDRKYELSISIQNRRVREDVYGV